MQGPFAIVLALIEPVQAAWQTVYSSDFSYVYMQSVNGSLYSVPISAENVTQENLEAHTKEIASAPTNSSLVLDNDGNLLAVWGSQGCGKSPIEISQYDPQHNQWTSVGQSSMKNQNWFLESQTVWLDRSSKQIYIYGGSCQGATQQGFYVYFLKNNTFAEITSQNKVMPRQIAAAQTIPLNDYETLLVGGRSGNAWVSMQQVAIWKSNSWAFDSVGNSTGIDSRENPLLLPVWEFGLNGTSGSVNEVIVIGGTVAGRAANPYMAMMKRSKTQGWYWTVPDEESLISVSFAACTLYTTLAKLEPPSKSEAGVGKISLYNEETHNKWSLVNAVSIPLQNNAQKKPENSKESHGTSKAMVAVVSTLLPIIVLALFAIATWWWLRQRRQRRLFLHPNRRGMLQSQHSANSSINTDPWSLPTQPPVRTSTIPPIPQPEPDSSSIMMMENNEGNLLFLSQRKRNLRVVNPDNEFIRTDNISRENSRRETRETSWSSSSKMNPFISNVEHREKDFDLGSL